VSRTYARARPALYPAGPHEKVSSRAWNFVAFVYTCAAAERAGVGCYFRVVLLVVWAESWGINLKVEAHNLSAEIVQES
jgi:hypothetical protein